MCVFFKFKLNECFKIVCGYISDEKIKLVNKIEKKIFEILFV